MPPVSAVGGRTFTAHLQLPNRDARTFVLGQTLAQDFMQGADLRQRLRLNSDSAGNVIAKCAERFAQFVKKRGMIVAAQFDIGLFRTGFSIRRHGEGPREQGSEVPGRGEVNV